MPPTLNKAEHDFLTALMGGVEIMHDGYLPFVQDGDARKPLSRKTYDALAGKGCITKVGEKVSVTKIGEAAKLATDQIAKLAERDADMPDPRTAPEEWVKAARGKAALYLNNRGLVNHVNVTQVLDQLFGTRAERKQAPGATMVNRQGLIGNLPGIYEILDSELRAWHEDLETPMATSSPFNKTKYRTADTENAEIAALDEAFGSGPTIPEPPPANEPAPVAPPAPEPPPAQEAKAEPPPAPARWSLDDEKVKAFWAKVDDVAAGYLVDSMAARSLVVTILQERGCAVLADFQGTAAELVAELRKRIRATDDAPAKSEPATPPPAAPKLPPVNTALTAPAPRKPITEDRAPVNRWWVGNQQWQLDPMSLAKAVAQSGMYPNTNTPEKALVAMFKGIELGVSPLAALEHITVIKGKPTVSGALMLALLRKEGVSVQFIVRDDQRVKLRMTRPDNGDSVEVEWTIDKARKAGLTGKDVWQAYTRDMLTWRAVSEAARLIAPDILVYGGIPQYTSEELAPDGVIDEQGGFAA